MWPSTPGRRVALAVGAVLVAGGLAFGAVSPPEHCPTVTSAGSATRPARSSNGSPATKTLTAHGCTFQAPTDGVADDYNVVRHAGAVMGLYMAAGYGSRARSTRRTGPRMDPGSAGGRGNWAAAANLAANRRSAPRRSSSPDLRAAGADRRRKRRRVDDRAVTIPGRTNRTERRRAIELRHGAGAPVAGEHRSTTRARRTGRSPPWLGCSPTGRGTASPTGSAPTWRRSETTPRTIGRRLADHWAAYGLAETSASATWRTTGR